jgi:hypothetical protein
MPKVREALSHEGGHGGQEKGPAPRVVLAGLHVPMTEHVGASILLGKSLLRTLLKLANLKLTTSSQLLALMLAPAML